jgi:hypothetical protein
VSDNEYVTSLVVNIFDESMTHGPTSLEIVLPEDVEDPASFAKGAYAGIKALYEHFGVTEVGGTLNTEIPLPDDDTD